MSSRKVKHIAVIAVLILLLSGFFPGKEDLYFEITKNIDLFSKVYKEISFNYVDDVDPEQFMRAGIRGMLGSLDPYTIFIDENKRDEIDLITNGKYGGIGITIGIRNDKITVVEVLEGYSAQRQGIRVGDVIIEAGGKILSPANIDEMSKLVKGSPGTAVELKVVRNDDKDTVHFDLIREEVIVKNVTYYGFYPEESNNAYIKLSNFSRSAGDEIKRALKDLKSQKEIESIVLDLRGNPGGLLDVAVDICDKFLAKDQLIVTTKGRNPATEKKYYSTHEPMVDSKIVVLVNSGTASASEIVAGALQDHDRAVILGTKSFGKGLVQTITPLSFNTSLKITTAKYYTPSGRCIQKIDYSEANNVIADADSIIEQSYFTDNHRTVYSAGGITPDTVVNFEVEGELTRDLLAKGLFFRFADYYYYNGNYTDFTALPSDEKIFSDFKAYLKSQNFIYESEASKQVEKLLADVKT